MTVMHDFFDGLATGFGEVPETLYHYTTQVGLLGIIGNDELWMTHTQYLNDTQEFRHAIDLVIAEIKRRIAAATGSLEKIILGEMLGNLSPDNASMNVCVACFSEVGDSLSQWRAYGGSVAGYSIEFCVSHMLLVTGREGFQLARCIYDDGEKRDLVANFVEANLQNIVQHRDEPSTVDNDPQYWRKGGEMVAYLNRFGPVLKDESFSDEREWRIISKPLMCTRETFGYRPGASMIIPYYRLALTNTIEQPGEKRFRTVVVGPTPHREQAAAAVRSLLASRHLASNLTPGGTVNVEISKVPYRAW